MEINTRISSLDNLVQEIDHELTVNCRINKETRNKINSYLNEIKSRISKMDRSFEDLIQDIEIIREEIK
jgi:archaellum component FlaC